MRGGERESQRENERERDRERKRCERREREGGGSKVGGKGWRDGGRGRVEKDGERGWGLLRD